MSATLEAPPGSLVAFLAARGARAHELEELARVLRTIVPACVGGALRLAGARAAALVGLSKTAWLRRRDRLVALGVLQVEAGALGRGAQPAEASEVRVASWALDLARPDRADRAPDRRADRGGQGTGGRGVRLEPGRNESQAQPKKEETSSPPSSSPSSPSTESGGLRTGVRTGPREDRTGPSGQEVGQAPSVDALALVLGTLNEGVRAVLALAERLGRLVEALLARGGLAAAPSGPAVAVSPSPRETRPPEEARGVLWGPDAPDRAALLERVRAILASDPPGGRAEDARCYPERRVAAVLNHLTLAKARGRRVRSPAGVFWKALADASYKLEDGADCDPEVVARLVREAPEERSASRGAHRDVKPTNVLEPTPAPIGGALPFEQLRARRAACARVFDALPEERRSELRARAGVIARRRIDEGKARESMLGSLEIDARHELLEAEHADQVNAALASARGRTT